MCGLSLALERHVKKATEGTASDWEPLAGKKGGDRGPHTPSLQCVPRLFYLLHRTQDLAGVAAIGYEHAGENEYDTSNRLETGAPARCSATR